MPRTLTQGIDIKHLGSPDEVRSFEKGKVELFKVGGRTIGRATFEPGWKWSTCVKPIAKTESCQAAHTCFQLSGRMHIVLDGGKEFDVGPGDFFYLPAGHDGWVVGDEAVVCLDFEGMIDYAKPSAGRQAQSGRRH